jgi:hypothetical protein
MNRLLLEVIMTRKDCEALSKSEFKGLFFSPIDVESSVNSFYDSRESELAEKLFVASIGGSGSLDDSHTLLKMDVAAMKENCLLLARRYLGYNAE